MNENPASDLPEPDPVSEPKQRPWQAVERWSISLGVVSLLATLTAATVSLIVAISLASAQARAQRPQPTLDLVTYVPDEPLRPASGGSNAGLVSRTEVAQVYNAGGTTASIAAIRTAGRSSAVKSWASLDPSTGRIMRDAPIAVPPGEYRFVIVDIPATVAYPSPLTMSDSNSRRLQRRKASATDRFSALVGRLQQTCGHAATSCPAALTD